ncbi:bifunctional hydroxymethylpyrimidine kinase/phosphomethylpyrimidine kinase [Longispora albida]|uniref:bifunctional hydroxymethylpyrimidine kinase/phosphomethylpyrimidine kinase n=1 Tax=Longispora albida TaxID=203523 RepID=UPI00068415AF|nr:bifunctional hydroxymethylpyrimidine kinase/phosphomethylpyrimidine kinase [Longispora albida]
MTQPPIALTVAGSDSGGGAGLQADLKTFASHGVFGTSVVTALTAQNTVGVRGVSVTPADFVAAQLEAVLSDLPPKAVKTGMLASAETIALLMGYDLPLLVVDPVLVATSGDVLFDGAAEYFALFGRAAVITPNMSEAATLLKTRISTVDDMADAARELAKSGPECVVVKGGHLDGEAIDVVYHGGRITFLSAPRISTRNSHGTGCTFAASVAAQLALGASIPDALSHAKHYVTRALAASAGWRLGNGHGPLSWKEIENAPQGLR